MAIDYPEFGYFCEVAAEILGVTPEQIERLLNVGLASCALVAPQAGFRDTDVYPTLLEKAAVLLERSARNHPLPDGNKRTPFFLAGESLRDDGTPLNGSLPDIDVPMVEQIAAGTWTSSFPSWSRRPTHLTLWSHTVDARA